MKFEKRICGITMIPESDFDTEILRTLRSEIIERIIFEREKIVENHRDGNLQIDFSKEW